MKKTNSILLTALLVIGLVACSTPAEISTPSFVATAVPTVVKFIDPVLEEMIRGAMGKTEGDITLAEAQAVTRMNLSNELQSYISEETPIKDISGLE
ncbi:MAG: hypothetical protein ABFD50_20730, partial [Smithella sp.]